MTDATWTKPPTTTDLDVLAEFWLLLASSAAAGDVESQALLHGTFGPWASALFKALAS